MCSDSQHSDGVFASSLCVRLGQSACFVPMRAVTADSLMARSLCPCAGTPTLLQHVRSQQSVYFVWELTWAQEPPPSLCGRFSVRFCPASEEQLSVSLKPYIYDFQVENFFVCIVLFFGGVEGVGRKMRGSFLFFVI